jgi:hypothetical protein
MPRLRGRLNLTLRPIGLAGGAWWRICWTTVGSLTTPSPPRRKINVPTTGLTDRLILHAKTLDEVAVFDADGTELASRPLAPEAPGPGA